MAQTSGYMSHYIMPYKYGKRARNFRRAFLFLFYFSLRYFLGVFMKQLFHSRLLDRR